MTLFTNFAALVTSPYAATILVASAAADLPIHTLFHTPGYTGGYKCFDPPGLAIQSPHTASDKNFFDAVFVTI